VLALASISLLLVFFLRDPRQSLRIIARRRDLLEPASNHFATASTFSHLRDVGLAARALSSHRLAAYARRRAIHDFRRAILIPGRRASVAQSIFGGGSCFVGGTAGQPCRPRRTMARMARGSLAYLFLALLLRSSILGLGLTAARIAQGGGEVISLTVAACGCFSISSLMVQGGRDDHFAQRCVLTWGSGLSVCSLQRILALRRRAGISLVPRSWLVFRMSACLRGAVFLADMCRAFCYSAVF